MPKRALSSARPAAARAPLPAGRRFSGWLHGSGMQVVADAMALVAAFVVAFFFAGAVNQLMVHQEYLRLSSPHIPRHAVIYGLFALGVLVVLYNRGHYPAHPSQRLPWWHQVRQILLIAVSAMLLQGFLHYVLKYPLSRLWVGSAWMLTIPLLLLARMGVRRLGRKLGGWSVPTLLIGGRENVLETLFALHSDTYTDYTIHSIILISKGEIAPDELPARYAQVPVSHGMDAARDAIRTFATRTATRFVVLAPDESTPSLTAQLVGQLRASGLEFGMVPPVQSVSLYEIPVKFFFGHNVVMFQPSLATHRPLQRLAKRGVDVLGASFGLLALAPLFLLLAWLIRRQGGPGKIFFGQTRVGQGGRPFTCYKFRSMVHNAAEVLAALLTTDAAARAEWARDFKLKHDPRITPIGRLLRASSLDELPQLWNVLKGDMSLVGPRPIVPEETRYYEDKLTDYASVRPGVTGLWQVSGRNDISYRYRVYLDSWYARHWSVWHDLVILFRTVKIVVRRSGAY